MDDKEKKMLLELEDKASSILSEFMLRTAKFEELVSVGSKYLVGFHEAAELLQRPAVHKASEVVDGIIKANETKRLKAYVQAGCINGYDGVQNISKCKDLSYFKLGDGVGKLSLTPPPSALVYAGGNLIEVCDCQRGLQDYLAEAKVLLNEIHCFVDDMVSVLQTSNEIGHSGDGLVPQDTSFEEEAVESCSVQKPKVIDCASIMGTIYSMVKQDYTMQEKIICSLSLKSTSAELQSYCFMWSLRPFINDDIMHQAWKLIQQL